MTTSYPGALDTLTNPAASDPTTAPSHADQHANANDAIEAVEARLGTSSSAASLNTISLAGGQIAFPATQAPSANPNALDDYAEGTWTPALAYATVGSSTWAVTTAVGWYTKIGRLVTFQCFYSGVPTNGTGNGALQLSTLPFTPSATANTNARISVEMGGYTKAGYTVAYINVIPGATTANFLATGSGVAPVTMAVGDIPSGGTVLVSFVGSYIV